MSERVAWFSAGVSSFVTCYLGNPDRIVYINVAEQHPDSLRFLADCEELLKKPIEIIGSLDYKQSAYEVFKEKKFIHSAHYAPCTQMLKKRVRQEWETHNLTDGTVYLWGYDADETARAERVKKNSVVPCEFPLIEKGFHKSDCHGLAERLGLRRPKMYDLGYPNNNCIGCVKGGMGYWNHIRKDFPETFERMSELEQEIGHHAIKETFLKDLDESRGRKQIEVFPTCGFACADEMDGGASDGI